MAGKYLRASRASRRDSPRPKFQLGDYVVDVDGSRRGEVSFVGEYDPYIGGYRYKVLEQNGRRHFWNEKSMRKFPKSARDSLAKAKRHGAYLDRNSSHRGARIMSARTLSRDRSVSSAAKKESVRAHAMSAAYNRGEIPHAHAARAHEQAADAHQRAANRSKGDTSERHAKLMLEHVDHAMRHERGPSRDRDRLRHRRNPSAPPQKTQKWISKKIRLLRHEGYPERQAIAIAYRMAGVSRKNNASRKRARGHEAIPSLRGAKMNKRAALRKP